jgi:hypothetical protein
MAERWHHLTCLSCDWTAAIQVQVPGGDEPSLEMFTVDHEPHGHGVFLRDDGGVEPYKAKSAPLDS